MTIRTVVVKTLPPITWSIDEHLNLTIYVQNGDVHSMIHNQIHALVEFAVAFMTGVGGDAIDEFIRNNPNFKDLTAIPNSPLLSAHLVASTVNSVITNSVAALRER